MAPRPRLIMMVSGAVVVSAAHGFTNAYTCSCIAQWAHCDPVHQYTKKADLAHCAMWQSTSTVPQ